MLKIFSRLFPLSFLRVCRLRDTGCSVLHLVDLAHEYDVHGSLLHHSLSLSLRKKQDASDHAAEDRGCLGDQHRHLLARLRPGHRQRRERSLSRHLCPESPFVQALRIGLRLLHPISDHHCHLRPDDAFPTQRPGEQEEVQSRTQSKADLHAVGTHHQSIRRDRPNYPASVLTECGHRATRRAGEHGGHDQCEPQQQHGECAEPVVPSELCGEQL